MDIFLTPEEIAVRQKVRDYFLAKAGEGAVTPDESEAPPDLERLLGDMGFPGAGSPASSGPTALLKRALAIEEISAASPRLGRAFLGSRSEPGAEAGPGGAAVRIAWAMGFAAGVYASCLDAARERGLFGSTLMGHQKVQVALADLLAELEAARLQAYRALRLVDRGETGRGEAELGRAALLADKARAEAEALAAILLDGRRLDEGMPENERSRE